MILLQIVKNHRAYSPLLFILPDGQVDGRPVAVVFLLDQVDGGGRRGRGQHHRRGRPGLVVREADVLRQVEHELLADGAAGDVEVEQVLLRRHRHRRRRRLLLERQRAVWFLCLELEMQMCAVGKWVPRTISGITIEIHDFSSITLTHEI